MSPDNIVTVNTESDTADAVDQFEGMSERELLVYIATNVAHAVTLIEQGVGSIEPLLASPKFKLLGGMLGIK